MDRVHCVYADSMESLLTEATSVLRMDKPAEYLFTVGGTPVRCCVSYRAGADCSRTSRPGVLGLGGKG